MTYIKSLMKANILCLIPDSTTRYPSSNMSVASHVTFHINNLSTLCASIPPSVKWG